jgi:hypothetical protein
VVGDVDTELAVQPQNYVECQLVPCPQDEMTAQANDSQGKSWVLEDNHHLQKKGLVMGCIKVT